MSGIPIGQWSGSDATKQLEATILALSAATERQTRTMLRLTWAMLLLTVLMTAAVGVQIAMALRAT